MAFTPLPADADPSLNLEEEWRLLDAMVVVDTVRHDLVKEKASQKRSTDRVICTLWCGATHPPGDLRQPSVKCNQSTCPDVEHAVRALRFKIAGAHAGCIATAEAARTAAGGPPSRQPPDAIALMMAPALARRLDIQAASAKARADVAVKEAALAQAAADAAWAPLQTSAVAKRQCTGAADEGVWVPWLQSTPPSVATWDLKQWRDYEDEEQKRRTVKVSKVAGQAVGQEPPVPRGGKEGFLHHHRRGLIGAVQSWARGSRDHVVSMLVALIGSEQGFGIESEVRARLADAKHVYDAETDALIVDRIVGALSQVKFGAEHSRHAYHTILAACAHVCVTERHSSGAEFDASGMARRFSARLQVRRGRRTRSKKQQEAGEVGAPYTYLQATNRRVEFDRAVQAAQAPLCVGDAVLVRGQPGKLVGIHGAGCSVEFRVGEVYETITYLEMDHRKGGYRNARLQRPLPSLSRNTRSVRTDAIQADVVALVRAHVEERCARSPHQRDAVSRRIGPHLKEEAQSLILIETRDELYDSFMEKNPNVKLKRSKFYEVSKHGSP